MRLRSHPILYIHTIHNKQQQVFAPDAIMAVVDAAIRALFSERNPDPIERIVLVGRKGTRPAMYGPAPGAAATRLRL